MSKVRIIARLDIKGPNLVKGVHLEGLRVLGKPEFFAQQYYADGADELIYIDLVASLYGRDNLTEIVRRAAENIFVPLTVGGGVRSVDDIRALLRAGADKIAINTAAVNNPDLIKAGAETFGSQCIVVSIQARKRPDGSYECLTDNAREATGIDVLEWTEQAINLGAGELLVTAIDREGTARGYDSELIESISRISPIPVIAHGGAGSAKDIEKVIKDGHADAVSAASVFHYALLKDAASALDTLQEGNAEFLRQRGSVLSWGRKGIEPIRIYELKKVLLEAGIGTRILSADITV